MKIFHVRTFSELRYFMSLLVGENLLHFVFLPIRVSGLLSPGKLDRHRSMRYLTDLVPSLYMQFQHALFLMA